MNLFGEILKECNLLLEKKNEVTEDKIKDAIENCKIVSIMYNDGTPNGGKSWRYIYPVVFGELKKTGNKAIRAYQDGGSTSKIKETGTNHGMKQGWKLFRLDRIVAWYNQENTETDLSHVFTPQNLADLNTTGDKSFSKIYYHSPAIKVEYGIDSNPVTKTDINSGKPAKPEAQKEPIVKYTFNPDWKNQYSEKTNGISLDNSGNINYNSNKEDKLTAPQTKPILKTDLEPQNEIPQNEEPQNKQMTADETPVSKDEVNGEEDNTLTKTFNDYLDRWEKVETQD